MTNEDRIASKDDKNESDDEQSIMKMIRRT